MDNDGLHPQLEHFGKENILDIHKWKAIIEYFLHLIVFNVIRSY